MSTAEAHRAEPYELEAHSYTIEKWRKQVSDHRGGDHFVHHEAAFTVLPHRWLLDRLAQPDAIVVSGYYAGFPLGVASARIQLSPDGTRKTAVVDLILVDPEARGVGVGEAMMTKLIDWSRENACTSIEANALPGDRLTKNFFESNLMKARMLTLSRQLH